MIEVEAHNLLQSFLRSRRASPEQSRGLASWPHYLTMARLVARALRLGRSALIQTGVAPASHHHPYRFSYLIPGLIWSEPALIVAPEWLLTELQREEIPQLFQSRAMDSHLSGSVVRGVRPEEPNFRGILLATPEEWLGDRLGEREGFAPRIPTIIDGVDDLETWTRKQLTADLKPEDWTELLRGAGERADSVRQAQIDLTQAIFQRPPNPYRCHLLDRDERAILERLRRELTGGEPDAIGCDSGRFPPQYPDSWNQFWQQWQAPEQLRWVKVDRERGAFWLYCSPAEVSSSLGRIWPDQPVVLIGGALDLEKTAPTYRELVGLGEMTSVKFSPDRHSQLIQLYLPSRLPLPNTPKFQGALIEEIRGLLSLGAAVEGLTVLLIEDTPLRTQIGALFAGELGSRVQVETTKLDGRGILVTGWEFWRQHQGELPPPQLLAIATLPLPSLEHPLVAGRVNYYKRQHLDWFRLYLLPTALNELQRAVAPVRDSQGVVALFDSRVLHRSYGEQVLAAPSPMARIDYLDATWFNK